MGVGIEIGRLRRPRLSRLVCRQRLVGYVDELAGLLLQSSYVLHPLLERLEVLIKVKVAALPEGEFETESRDVRWHAAAGAGPHGGRPVPGPDQG